MRLRGAARPALWAVGGIGAVASIVAVSAAIASTITGVPTAPRVSQERVTVVSEAVGPTTESTAAGAGSYGLPDPPSQQWVASEAARTGIPARALVAYGGASLRMAKTDPGCRLGWATLAGIGAVESDHGTNGGSQLREDGTTTLLIRGPELNGSNGTAAIRATARTTRWHGDPTWDRAIGPMQFIPSTWEKWGSDGDGNGTADPNDIDDAAWTAARYLCASGADLASGAGWSAAIFSYNHSADYVSAVLSRASAYAS